MTTIATIQLQGQIERFGLHDTETNCYGLVAYDTGTPGIFRIAGDGGHQMFIFGWESLRNLRAAEPTGDFETDQELFYSCCKIWLGTDWEKRVQ